MKQTLLLIMTIATGVISFGQSQPDHLNIALTNNGVNGCSSGSGAYIGVALRSVGGTYTTIPAAEDFGVILRAPKSDFNLSDAINIVQVNSSLYGGTATSLMTPQAVVDAGDPYLYFPIALNSAAGLNLSALTVNNWSFTFALSFNNPKTPTQINKVVIVDQINNATLSAFVGTTVFSYLNIGDSNQLTNAAFNVLANPVPIATITAGGPLTFCTGKNVLLKANPATGYTYQWKKSGVNIAGAILANYTATVSGIYTVVGSNAAGCSTTSTGTTVLVNPVPIATITAGGLLTFCSGKNVLLKANTGAGYTYQWKKSGFDIAGAIQANYTATLSGVYTVVVTNAVGCSITSAGTTVLVNAVPIATTTAGGPLTFCTGKNVLLRAYPGTGYSYQWKKSGVNIAGAIQANYTATVSGVYTVVVTNAVGCSITSAGTTVLVNPVPIATISAAGPLIFCAAKNVVLKSITGAGYTYQWKKSGIIIAGAILPTYSATTTGFYNVVITNVAGCSTTSNAISVVVNPVPISTITAGGPLTFCAGKNVLLKAYPGPSYTYQWKKAGLIIAGAIQANYTATVSGVYTVVVTNAVGCS
ncbi:MAG: hypothetical protein H7Y01_02680, partial [Ferruginibacter sp.]|nr:hypothetical protein [Chitinophagaceae bacterium]